MLIFFSDFLIRCKKNITLDKTKKREHKEGASDRDEWEQFIDQKLLEVWRRPVDSSGLYEYKGTVYGTKEKMVFKIIQIWQAYLQAVAALWKRKTDLENSKVHVRT